MSLPFRAAIRSIRGKLTLAAVAPLIVILLLVALAASYLINASIVDQTQKQIRNDLNAARVVLQQEQQRLHELVRFSARSARVVTALQRGQLEDLAQFLNETKQRERIEVFNLTGLDGKPLLHHYPQGKSTAAFVASALKTGHTHGTVLFSETEMQLEDPDLPQRAQIFAPGQSDIPVERRGLIMIDAIPVLDTDGDPIGCLYGGILLNNNQPLVDRISNLLYGQDTFDGIAVGSATIFLGEHRVATTIRMKNNERALGTQVSPEVAEAVLKRGESWLARAQVVDEWYLTAYDPIFDDQGNALGALYVGMLEKPLTAVKTRSFIALFCLLILGCLLGGLLAGFLAKRLSRPVLELAESAEKIADGERDVPLPDAGQDEIGHLAAAFSKMTRSLQKSDNEFQQLNRELERKVVERTSQLEEKSLQLIKAQEQLLRQEKLAAIGSLATGVAHEINNPAAIIRGNVEILKMSLSADAPEQDEVREIMQQVERVSLITNNLLSFSGRQNINSEQVDINQLLVEVLNQINHQQPLGNVRVENKLDRLARVPGDSERLRQVFNNIILNALQAMNGEGVLRLTGCNEPEHIIVMISDTGPGVGEEQREKIFNPFYTTKKQGTGLGLSVSYGIIQAHNGYIGLIDDPSEGACFKIMLPV